MPTIWKRPIDLATVQSVNSHCAVEHVGIEFLEVGADFLSARVPVDARTRQPMGILHGGVSVVLAETLGSTGAAFAAEPGQRVVGLEVNANHLRSVTTGWVTGTARPIHLGRSTQVWQIEMKDEQGRPTCISRLTMAVLPDAP